MRRLSLYNEAIKAVKQGKAHHPRSWNNPYSPKSWVVTVGKVDVLFHNDTTVHIDPEGCVALSPWRLRRALRKVGIVAPPSVDTSRLLYETSRNVIDAAHLAHQRAWSMRTFGPESRLLGVLDHIRKELVEIEADPTDLEEWVDVIILALDGAWRAGSEPQEIIDAVMAKQAKNEARTWPDWRTISPDKAIEHVE